jgi:hypothetical protein
MERAKEDFLPLEGKTSEARQPSWSEFQAMGY